VNPFAEAMFLLQSSQYEIDTYFNLFFSPRSGGYNQEQYINAFYETGKALGYPSKTLTELTTHIKKLNVSDYAQFYSGVVTGLKVFNPDQYENALGKFRDLTQGVLFNLENFLNKGDSMQSLLANQFVIIEALKLPKSSLVYQEEFFKNLDLSLFTRLKIKGISALIPPHPRLNWLKTAEVWRHNARATLGDINDKQLPYILYPKKDSTIQKAIMIASAVVAVVIIAPYLGATLSSSIKSAASAVSNLGKAAVTKVGELTTMASGAAVSDAEARIENLVLGSMKETVQADEIKNREEARILNRTATQLENKPASKNTLILPVTAISIFLMSR